MGKLRAGLRKVTGRSLTLKPPHQGEQTFRNVEKEGRAFDCFLQDHLPNASWETFRRGRGGRSPPRARAALPELAALRKRAEADLPGGRRAAHQRSTTGKAWKMIDRIDAALVRVLQDCRLPAGVSIESGAVRVVRRLCPKAACERARRAGLLHRGGRIRGHADGGGASICRQGGPRWS